MKLRLKFIEFLIIFTLHFILWLMTHLVIASWITRLKSREKKLSRMKWFYANLSRFQKHEGASYKGLQCLGSLASFILGLSRNPPPHETRWVQAKFNTLWRAIQTETGFLRFVFIIVFLCIFVLVLLQWLKLVAVRLLSIFEYNHQIVFNSHLHCARVVALTGYSREFLVGVCRPVIQILTLCQIKKCYFPHTFSDPVC